MKNKDTKFKSFSFIFDALYFVILIILSLVIGVLLNNIAYSLIIALFIFVLKVLYENYKLEKIILDFDNKSSLAESDFETNSESESKSVISRFKISEFME